MPSTRYAAPGSNPDDSPERYLASASVRGISIGNNIICRIGRTLPDNERAAMYWLSNYARLLDLTADDLADQIDMEPREIREALTNPSADRTRFIRQVATLRASFEAGLRRGRKDPDHIIPPMRSRVFREAYCQIADTKVRRKIKNAIRFAETQSQIVEVIGETRLGKTVCAAQEYFLRLDHAAWLTVPKQTDLRSFLTSLAEALGVSVGTCDKIAILSNKIKATIGARRISLLFVEEAHRLWPRETHLDPVRLDYLRDLWEYDGLNVVILATPQFTNSSAARLRSSENWEAGQWVGRVQAYDLPANLDDADLRAIALNHAPEADADIIAQLVAHAKSSKGYAGIMVKSIERARFISEDTGKPLNLDTVKRAQTLIDREARAAVLAAAEHSHTPRRR